MPTVRETADGDAQATADHRASADRLSLFWRTKIEGLAQEVDIIEVDEDELEFYIKKFCHWACSTPIPYKFDENLKPTSKNKMRHNLYSTIIGYIGKHLLDIRRKFVNLNDWKDLKTMVEVPKWWTNARDTFEDVYDRMRINLTDDFVFGVNECIPLYRNNPHYYPDDFGPDGEPIHNLLAQIDGNLIVTNLIKKASTNKNALQHRCWLVLLDTCIGRSGELRLVKFTEWSIITALQILKIIWYDLKNKTQYALAILHNREGWKFCVFHALGAYWAVENGLFRDDDDVKIGAKLVLFPALYRVQQRSAPKKVANAIKGGCPQGTPKSIIDGISGKSTKCGGLTETYNHGDVSNPQARAVAGHSITQGAGDSYIDKNNPLNGIHAMRARSGYYNLKGKDHLPSLSAIGTTNFPQATKFIKELYVVSIQLFDVGERLYPLLTTTTASLILHHPTVTEELGYGNVISQYLIKAARKARLVDTRYNNIPYEQVLYKWSILIREELENRITEGMKAKPDVVSLTEGVNTLITMHSKTTALCAELVSQNQP